MTRSSCAEGSLERSSYLFVQDGLIVSCGVLYALCYFFYMARTYKDKTLSGSVEFLYVLEVVHSAREVFH